MRTSLFRALALAATAALSQACGEGPAFPVPGGPPKAIAVDVSLPVYVLGRWTISGVTETLTEQLAKYNIRVVDYRAHPDAIAIVDLGRITYRDWQEVDVFLFSEGNSRLLGRIPVPDLAWTTLEAASVPAAELIARAIWNPKIEPAERPSAFVAAGTSRDDRLPLDILGFRARASARAASSQ